VIVTAAVVVVVGVTALVVVRSTGSGEDADPAASEIVRIGPTSGEQVEGYVDRAGTALANAGSGSVLALVSLTAYQKPTDLVATLSTYQVKRVYARVPADGIQTRLDSYPVITAAVDIPAGMRSLALRRAQEAAREKAEAARITDPAKRKLATDNALISQGEAAAYQDGCGCLYGAVVSAPADRLQELSQKPGIRVVEPAPAGTEIARAVFVPLQPEQTDVVKPPPDSGAPASPGPSGWTRSTPTPTQSQVPVR